MVDVSKLDTTALKALVYDAMIQRDNLNQQIMTLNQLIAQRGNETNEKPNKPEKEKTSK